MRLRAAFLATGWSLGQRRLAMTGAIAVATLATWAVLPANGPFGALILVVTLPLWPIAAWRAIGMWRGTVSHATMSFVPVSAWPLSIDRYQAGAPCLVMSGVGLAFMTDAVLLIDPRHAVGTWLATAGLVAWVVFLGLAVLVAATFSPRFLLPATLRRGRLS
jgi:hypothetical protein